MSKYIWIIDDDDRFRERLVRALKRREYQVIGFSNGEAAISHEEEGAHPEAVLLDLRMPGEWGLNILEALLSKYPELHVVLLTAFGSIATAMEALRLGAKDYLLKPVGINEIERAICGTERVTRRSTFEDNGLPTLAEVEWEHINRVLSECQGNIRKSAERLGMHRRTLQRKLSKYPQFNAKSNDS